jgi:PKD repeat protein
VSFTATNNSGCGPLEVSFNNTTEGGESWSWSFPGGEPASSTEENPSVIYRNPGTYTVTLVATNAFGNSAFSRENTVTVLAPTAADFSHEMDVTTANFTDASTGATSLEWLFPDGSTSTLANPSYTFPGNGTYTVTLIATGPCNTDTVSQEILIDGPLPEVSISQDIASGCAPMTVQFEDASSETPTTWSWSFPGGEPASSALANPLVTYAEAGLYEVSLTVRNAYGESTETWTDYIAVAAAPTASVIERITTDGMTYTFTTSPADDTWDYQWTLPDGSTQDSPQASYTFTESGSYPLSVMLSNDCGSLTLTDEIVVNISATENPGWAQQLFLYPNPTAGDLQIRATAWPAAGSLEIRLFNNLGQRLQSQVLNLGSGSWQHSLDLDNLPAGTYQLQFLWEGSWWTAKISKI